MCLGRRGRTSQDIMIRTSALWTGLPLLSIGQGQGIGTNDREKSMPDIFLIGDSTVQAGGAPFYGWGSALGHFCREGVRVHNHARSGESSRSFLYRNLFDPIREQLGKDDLLLIQFGHNDQKDDPERHTDPQGSFADYLKAYVDAARQKSARAALVTPVCRRHFLPDGNLLYTHGEYPLAVRTLAQRCGIPCIDLKRLSRELYLSLGPEDTAGLFVRIPPGNHPEYPRGHDDLTHFSLDGAMRIAALAASAILAQDTLADLIDPKTLQ